MYNSYNKDKKCIGIWRVRYGEGNYVYNKNMTPLSHGEGGSFRKGYKV